MSNEFAETTGEGVEEFLDKVQQNMLQKIRSGEILSFNGFTPDFVKACFEEVENDSNNEHQ